MRQCKDCKHLTVVGNLTLCKNPKVTVVPTTGFHVTKFADCERMFLVGKCGYLGWYFEKKNEDSTTK